MQRFKSPLSSLPYLCLFLLVIICSACESTSVVVIKPTPTAIPSPTVTPLPTPIATPSPSLTTYMGTNFSIDRPSSWKVQKGTDGSLQTLQLSGPIATMIIMTSTATNNAGTDAAYNVTDSGMSAIATTLSYPQRTTLPPTTVDGMQWIQMMMMGLGKVDGDELAMKFVALGVQHPTDGVFCIILESAKADFDIVDPQFFQPMLASFKFK